MREIAIRFKRSIPTVQGYLRALERKGFIFKDSHKSRSILVKDSHIGKTVRVPIFGVITKDGIQNFEELNKAISIPSDWLVGDKNEFYAFTVSGFEMSEDGLIDGDNIIIRNQAYNIDGETVLGIIYENSTQKVVLKKIFDQGVTVKLESQNPSLKSIIIPKTQFEVKGKFVGLLRKL